jgi:hypothetical protein
MLMEEPSPPRIPNDRAVFSPDTSDDFDGFGGTNESDFERGDTSMMESFVGENQTFLQSGDFDLVNSFVVETADGATTEQKPAEDDATRSSTEALVTSILEISFSSHPSEYLSKLTEQVLPHLGVNHELLPTVFAWACQMADDYDDSSEDGLEKAILLLRSVDDAMKRLSLQMHSSFAHYAPFVDRLVNSRRRVNDSSLDVSVGSVHLDKSMSFSEKAVNPFEGPRPRPTVLEIASMKRGAKKASKLLRIVEKFDTFDEKNEESIELKLDEARLLQRARSLGLRRDRASLREFEYKGGTKYLCTELIRSFSSKAGSHQRRLLDLTTNVQPFCEASGCHYDPALLRYGTELCGGKSTTPEAIEEATSIARCCESSAAKCQTMLMVLRSALFCQFSPEWLTNISKEAVAWANGDQSLQSELEEVSRLLLVDGIVGRYCGDGAKKLFHVDVPLAATRLFNIVTRSLKSESVLTDIIDLCGAFNHLSMEDGCSRLIEEAIIQGNTQMAVAFLQKMYSKNAVMAHDVFSRVMTYCTDFLDEVSARAHSDSISIERAQAKGVASCALEMTKIALTHARSSVLCKLGKGFSACQYTVSKLESLRHDFELIQMFQVEFNVALRLSDLHRPDALVSIAADLLSDLVDAYKINDQESANIIATNMRRACALLASGSDNGGLSEADLLFAAAQKPAQELACTTEGTKSIDFLSDLGILEATESQLGSVCCLSLALSFCLRSSKKSRKTNLMNDMKGLVLASSILQDFALSSCTSEILAKVTSFACLSDMVSQVLFRADEGYGEELDQFRKFLMERAVTKRQWFLLATKHSSLDNLTEGPIHVNRPSFHPSWYIGDGLLLPPQEALEGVIEYCKESMDLQPLSNPISGIESFASDRYALALALRVLSSSTVTKSCHPQFESSSDLFDGHFDNLIHALVERYLGGVGNGITSGVVDSELAVTYLLSLPPKAALKEFMAALHAAIKMRDFKRVGALATVGKAASSRVSLLCSKESQSYRYWTRAKLLSQCEKLSTCASWWELLKALNVKFDPHLFDIISKTAETNSGSKKSREDSYEASIIPGIILAMSQNGNTLEQTLAETSRFALDFGLPSELPIQSYVEFLLGPIDLSEIPDDIRGNISVLESTARNMLHCLESQSKRFGVLRRCLMKFESSEICTDYERLSVVLGLYQSETLSTMADEMSSAFSKEAELIDRRCEALAILSSYYHREKTKARPSFSKLFLPLPPSIKEHDSSEGSNTISCHVLGWEAKSPLGGFDPLKELEEPLRTCCNTNITSALSLLCIPLGVPRGYIRARSLISKFEMSKSEGGALPSFDEVIKVLNVLHSAADKAELSHWCSEQYNLNHPEKMSCLDFALTEAMKASSEAEQTTGEKHSEAAALARVKRVTAAKDILMARLGIDKVLRAAKEKSDGTRALLFALQKLETWLDQNVWEQEDVFVPEEFIEKLLNEASQVTSETVLSECYAMSVGQFQSFAQTVHCCCDFISETYSHVQIGQIARTLTSRWLFHGDTQSFLTSGESNENNAVMQLQNSSLLDINEEDTLDFTVDFAALRNDALWGSSEMENSSNGKRKLAMEEEPSSLNASSMREKSESSSIRCGLRVVFVVASTLEYYRAFPSKSHDSFDPDQENLPNHKPSPASSKRRGILSKSSGNDSKERKHHDNVLQHCRELLQIIFAKSLSADRVIAGLKESSITLTFAMRHRSLRVAALLLPQEALEEIMTEHVLSAKMSSLSLNDCAFAAFCAKELEELSLPVPNSDLLQLSQMHFQSFARALWRHHRNMEGSKGRLLLLILELYLKDSISDFAFFRTIMKEIEALKLPRTLLLAFESIMRYMSKMGQQEAQRFLDATNVDTNRILSKVLEMVFAELKKTRKVTLTDQHEEIHTLNQLGRILCSFSATDFGQDLLVKFCSVLVDETQNVADYPHRHESYKKLVVQSLENIISEELQSKIKCRFSLDGVQS